MNEEQYFYVNDGAILKDLNDFKAVNEFYGKWFKENPPARETVQVSALPKGARIEISVIAVK